MKKVKIYETGCPLCGVQNQESPLLLQYRHLKLHPFLKRLQMKRQMKRQMGMRISLMEITIRRVLDHIED